MALRTPWAGPHAGQLCRLNADGTLTPVDPPPPGEPFAHVLTDGAFGSDRKRIGVVGAAQSLHDECRKRGVPMDLEACQRRVGAARTRQDNRESP